MSSLVSANYRELALDEVATIAAECANAWQDPRIPELQYQVVRGELATFLSGGSVAPYDALLKCWEHIKIPVPSVLDVGACGGYYQSIIQSRGYNIHYTALDYSEAFANFARSLYPRIRYEIGEATALPFEDNTFDVVLSGACIMHVADYPKAIQEAGRVAKRYVIFARTPLLSTKPTTYFQKDAYGIPCLEIHFNIPELIQLFSDSGLEVRHSEHVFWDEAAGFGHETFLLEKVGPEPYASNKNV